MRRMKREVIDLTEDSAKKAKVIDLVEEIECQCCFCEWPLAAMVQCTEAHVFCASCLARYAKESVFGAGRATLSCMSTDDCPGLFSDAMLEKALPAKEFKQCQQTAALAAARSARVPLASCPECGSLAEANAKKLFECPDCSYRSCRNCHKLYHGEVACGENSDEQRRLDSEEAKTRETLRQCPKCSAEFIKDHGCNKITCSCGALICYVCGVLIDLEVGYAHFCQTPHCRHDTCNKCALWDPSDHSAAPMLPPPGGAGFADALPFIRDLLIMPPHPIHHRHHRDHLFRPPHAPRRRHRFRPHHWDD